MELVTAAERIVDSVKRADWKGDRIGFCLRLTPETKRYVQAQARRRGISMTALINEALAEHALVRLK